MGSEFLVTREIQERLNKQISGVIILKVGVFLSVDISGNFIHLERNFIHFLNLVPRRASITPVSAPVSKLLKSRASAGWLILNKPVIF